MVFEARDHPDNFRPPAAIKPSRTWGDDDERCEAFALSLFETAEALVVEMAALEKNFKQLRKRIGNHIATGNIETTDGVMSTPDQKGHFNLHESETCQLESKFNWIGPLP